MLQDVANPKVGELLQYLNTMSNYHRDRSFFSARDLGVQKVDKEKFQRLAQERITSSLFPVLRAAEESVTVIRYDEVGNIKPETRIGGRTFFAEDIIFQLRVSPNYESEVLASCFYQDRRLRKGVHDKYHPVLLAGGQLSGSSIYSVSTMPEFRRLGLSSCIMMMLEQVAINFYSLKCLYLSSSEIGRPVYLSLGYESYHETCPKAMRKDLSYHYE
jgi:hypothetical protein